MTRDSPTEHPKPVKMNQEKEQDTRKPDKGGRGCTDHGPRGGKGGKRREEVVDLSADRQGGV
jgi:hypothetical protein